MLGTSEETRCPSRNMPPHSMIPLSGPLSRRLANALWTLRATWALMLLSPLVFYAWATGYTAELAETIENGATWIAWGDEPPWDVWFIAAVIALAGMLIPYVIERRSAVRLQARVGRVIDPSRPGTYCSSPGFVPAYSDALISAAYARYSSRLALSFAMLASVLLLFTLGLNPASSHGLSGSCRYFWRPMDYLPVIVVVSVLVAAQFPTRHRMLGILRISARTNLDTRSRD